MTCDCCGATCHVAVNLIVLGDSIVAKRKADREGRITDGKEKILCCPKCWSSMNPDGG